MRKKLIAGNWKMHKKPAESADFVKSLIEHMQIHEDRDVLICPPATSLFPVSKTLSHNGNSPLKLGSQNVHFEKAGAFTGEISTEMLAEINVEYVICGHSERRNIFGETNDLVCKKVKKTAEAGMKPILCIGEKIEEREQGKTFDVLDLQLAESLKGFTLHQHLIVAYEPVWAIGTGKNATPRQAEEVHLFIRKQLEKMFNKKVSEGIIILYGGSVNPENIDAIMHQPNIDGALVGGASLKVDSFCRIIDYRT